MQKIWPVVKKFFLVFLVFILILDIFLILRHVFSNGKLQKVFGFAQVVVISGSMEPTIKAGDMIVIREASAYVVGDVITYHTGAALVTHRVIALNDGQLITQGDANNTVDEPIALEQVEGKMVFRLPWLGRVSLFLKTPAGLLVTGLIGIVLILVNIVSDSKEDQTAIKTGDSR